VTTWTGGARHKNHVICLTDSVSTRDSGLIGDCGADLRPLCTSVVVIIL